MQRTARWNTADSLRVMLLITLLTLLQSSTSCAVAAENDSTTASIRISEVLPQPLPDQSEWVELHNFGSEPVSLLGWQLFDQLSTATLLYTIPAELLLEPGAYLQLELPSAKLNNAADGVTLHTSSGEIIDTMNYAESSIDTSWSLVEGVWTQTTPTPGFANTAHQHSSHSDITVAAQETTHTTKESEPVELQLISIVACPPSDEQESIELHNPSQHKLSIDGWIVKDQSNNTKSLNTTLNPDSTTVVSWANALLNNSGDTITIIDDAGTELFTAEYSSCNTGEKLYLIDGLWQHQDEHTQTILSITPTATANNATESTPIAQEQTESSAATQPEDNQAQLAALLNGHDLQFFPHSSAHPPESTAAALTTDSHTTSTIEITSDTTKQLVSLFAIMSGSILAAYAGYQLYTQHAKHN